MNLLSVLPRRCPQQSIRRASWSTALLACMWVAACGSKPVVPDWSINASDASQRAMSAQLEGVARVADVEWGKARSEVAKTGQPALMARLALMHCGVQVASLDWQPCAAYAPLAQDAAPAEAAYARYLYGNLQPGDVALLPAQHQAVGDALAQGGAVAPAQLLAIADDRARLVAAAAAMRAGAVTLQAAWPVVDALATAQGWRRPLLAWMELERRRLESAGAVDAAQKLARRLEVLMEATPPR